MVSFEIYRGLLTIPVDSSIEIVPDTIVNLRGALVGYF